MSIKVPLPFPECPACGGSGSRGVHRGCSGELSVYPDSRVVHCELCGGDWNLYNSRYYCACGNVFTADEVSEELEVILGYCVMCARELENIAAREGAIRDAGRESLREFLLELVRGVARGTSYRIHVIVDTVVGFFTGQPG